MTTTVQNKFDVQMKKIDIYNYRLKQCVNVSNIFITLKKNLFGCFKIEETRDKDNETCLKEGGGI
jgi:hypothetical protein